MDLTYDALQLKPNGHTLTCLHYQINQYGRVNYKNENIKS